MDEKYNLKKIKTDRGSGVLLHISSLPSPYGIGTLGKEAYDFVDFLESARQKYWQVLPLGPTGYGDSPYQSFSAYAGNPYFIDLDFLIEQGLLSQEEVSMVDFGEDVKSVDYEKIYQGRYPLLYKAYERFIEKDHDALEDFQKENQDWLEDYMFYMAIKKEEGGKAWSLWEDKFRYRDQKALQDFKAHHTKELGFYAYLQFEFYRQWKALKDYANKKNILIVGDIPIYVAEDSADTWANPEIFELDDKLLPIFVGGCPPDDFSNDGQLWGNPLYRWDYLEETDYQWWVERIRWNFTLFDVLRIDHFRGFESYWKVPYQDETAREGHWVAGPSKKLFDCIRNKLGDLNIIAEDLGYMTKEVYEFREHTGFPGMKILQFAFNVNADSNYLPHNYTENCVVYTGTHDNDTIQGWEMNAPMEEILFAKKYMGIGEEGLNWGLIRGAMRSVARLAIFQMQDFLLLDNRARMNNPGTLGGNWIWRMEKKDPSPAIAKYLAELCRIYGR